MSFTNKFTFYLLIILIFPFKANGQEGRVFDGEFIVELIHEHPFDTILSLTCDSFGTTYVFGLVNDKKKLLRSVLEKNEFIDVDFTDISQIYFKENKLLFINDRNVTNSHYNLITEKLISNSNDKPIRIEGKEIQKNTKYFTKNGPVESDHSTIFDLVNNVGFVLIDSNIYKIQKEDIFEYRIFDSIQYQTRLAYPINDKVLVGFSSSNQLYLEKANSFIHLDKLPINKNYSKKRTYYHASHFENKVYLTDNLYEVTVLDLTNNSLRPVKKLNSLSIRYKNNISLKDGTILMGSLDGTILHFDPRSNSIIHIYNSKYYNTYRFFEDKNGLIWAGFTDGMAIIDLENKTLFECPELINNIQIGSSDPSGFSEYKDEMIITTYNNRILKSNSTDKLISSKNGKIDIDWSKLELKKSNDFAAIQNNEIEYIKQIRDKIIIKTEQEIYIYEGKSLKLFNPKTGFTGIMANFFIQNFSNGDVTLPLNGGYIKVKVDKKLEIEKNRYSIINLSESEKPLNNLYRINLQKSIEIPEAFQYLSIELLDKKTNEKVINSVYCINEKDTISTNDKRIIFATKDIKPHKIEAYPYGNIKKIEPPFIFEIKVLRKWYKTWWFGLLCFIVLLSIIFYVSTLIRHSQIQRRRIKSLETESLRSYMNPHFISNSLNSINYYILKNDKETASNYIVKFSKLIRRILSNSDQEFIALNDELDALKMYIEIEQMRFENKFTYSIEVDSSIDTSLEIPSFIIQPIVENAIWHGIIQKKEKGELTIKIIKENQAFLISVIDDGIGIEESRKLKSKTSTKRKSYGMQLIKKRLDILNDLYGQNHSITVMKASNVKQSGTRVDIKLSILNKK